MAALNKGQTVFTGLGTNTLTVTTTGLHTCRISTTMPPPSGIIVTIAQSGSASLSVSSAAPTTAQNHIELMQQLNCVAGDVITFTVASSNVADQALNVVTSILSVHVGTI